MNLTQAELANMKIDDDEILHQCPLTPEFSELTSSIKVLVEKTDMLITLNREIIKWLLIVVCVIALGRSAFDVGKDLIAHAIGGSSAAATK